LIPGEPLVRVRYLSHHYGARQALTDVSFDVDRGSAFGLFGPPGAGKTTALRALATLVAPVTGQIAIAGFDAAREPERVRQRLGYMADRPHAYPELTVEEYLAFFAATYRLDLRASVDRVLERTQIADCRDRSTASLSRAVAQRMHLARALLHDPELLLLDDPVGDLDDASRDAMLSLLAELRSAGKTLVMASRVLAHLSGLCPVVGVLKKGRLAPLDQRPANAMEREASMGEPS
jgi:ABC-2 type transport system ATP-binding protein